MYKRQGYVTVYGYSDGVMKPGQAYISNDGDSWTDVTDKDAYTGQPIIDVYKRQTVYGMPIFGSSRLAYSV